MNPAVLNLRRVLVHLVLGLLLLSAQQHAMRHWLSHAIEATHAKAQGAPAGGDCDACNGLAAFGAAMPGPTFALPVTVLADLAQPVFYRLTPPLSAAVVAYLSRAPPIPR